MQLVTEEARCDRTARILSAHLDELATTLERDALPRDVAVHLVESASVATAHAVALELLTPVRASALWQDHPTLARYS